MLDLIQSRENPFDMKLGHLIVSVLLLCGLPRAFAQACPMPEDVLGRSFDEAKHTMSKAVGENWSPNDVGCPDGYLNLMSDWQRGHCEIPGNESHARIMISGFEGSDTVVGIFYVLTSRMSVPDVRRLFAPGALKPVADYPMPLRAVVPAPSGDSLFVSNDGRRLLRVGPEHGNPDGQIVQLFDLHAVKREIAPLQACARLTRTLRDDGIRPTTEKY
ncbi:hypothetical protein [Burkholderia sp. BCC1644]|uniref:hypothetical protein n=1 Tax=Burkholderia sp. BCC1644 TaxID=2676293 RepID=UPI00158FB826|nr:hypothetical protein [Burkholderia sp. BCC1644]